MSRSNRSGEGIRVAMHDDSTAITRLLREADFAHVHADWHYPGQWLGLPTFVLAHEAESLTAEPSRTRRLFNASPGTLQACLAVAADPPPAAWVRLAAVARRQHAEALMSALFAAILDPLREAQISQVAWLLVDESAEDWLPALGFEPISEVITYSRLLNGSEVQPVDAPVEIRPADSTNLAQLAAIEARAFEPLWRHSELGLSLAMQQALSFDVAWLDGRAVGFQFSSSTMRGAHLSRITVDTDVQQQGVGSALLAHALAGYARKGITSVTLNTQIENLPSQNLYRRFGFQPSGERFPIWSINIE